MSEELLQILELWKKCRWLKHVGGQHENVRYLPNEVV